MHQFLKSLGISSPFSSRLRPTSPSGRGKRQQFQSNSQRKKSTLCKKTKPAPKKASKTKTTNQALKKKNPEAKTRHFFFACSETAGGKCFSAHGELGPAQAEPCLRHMVEKKRFATKSCASATFHLFYAPVQSRFYKTSGFGTLIFFSPYIASAFKCTRATRCVQKSLRNTFWILKKRNHTRVSDTLTRIYSVRSREGRELRIRLRFGSSRRSGNL